MSLIFYTPSGGVGTTFPSSPNNGDEYVYAADTSNGVFWRFKYYGATTKWVFIGGPPLYSYVATSEGTSSATYVALATAGPAVTLPFAGDYDVTIGAYFNCYAQYAYMSYDIGATGAVDDDAVQIYGDAYGYVTMSRMQRKTGLGAVALTAKYKSGGGSMSFLRRFMAVTPVQK